MSVYNTIRSDQDWAGFAVVIGCLIVITGIAWAFEHSLGFADPADLVPDDLPVLDHATCVHDGCTRVLCFCTTLHPRTGQPVTCPTADRPACLHSLVSRATTGGHCHEHQRSCPDCQLETTTMWGSVS